MGLDSAQQEVVEALTRVLHKYESMMQDWSIKNGEPPLPGHASVCGVDLGFTPEVRALQAAIASIEEHGVPQPKISINTNLDDPEV